jgi:hypothetical protein
MIFPVVYKYCPKCSKALTRSQVEGHGCLKAQPVFIYLSVIRGGK